MTDRLADIDAREKAAKANGWYPHRFGGGFDALVLSAREDIPWLVAEVRRLRNDLASSARTCRALSEMPDAEEFLTMAGEIADKHSWNPDAIPELAASLNELFARRAGLIE